VITTRREIHCASRLTIPSPEPTVVERAAAPPHICRQRAKPCLPIGIPPPLGQILMVLRATPGSSVSSFASCPSAPELGFKSNDESSRRPWHVVRLSVFRAPPSTLHSLTLNLPLSLSVDRVRRSCELYRKSVRFTTVWVGGCLGAAAAQWVASVGSVFGRFSKTPGLSPSSWPLALRLET